VRKWITIIIAIIALVSLVYNVIQHQSLNKKEDEMKQISENYMEQHEVTFSNAITFFEKGTGSEIEKLNSLIQEVDKAQMDFMAARTLSGYAPGGQFEVNNLIANGYLSILKGYRRQLEDPNFLSMSLTLNPQDQINDLKIIAAGLDHKYQTHDYNLYSDKEFFKDVYPQLKSEVKNTYFVGYK
jgi:hypothetical protein